MSSNMVDGQNGANHRFAALVLGAIGVVYGDIGTSPLYTLREVFQHGLDLTADNVLGILSLLFWSLIVVVTVKYVMVIMRADNKGEGGVLALGTLAQRCVGPKVGFGVMILCMIGMALFVGDSMITPAISVLSAFEGLNVAAPGLSPYIVPVSVVVIIGLFVIQRFGTGTVGKLFGPIMVAWFASLGLIGVIQIVEHPWVLCALNPFYALYFFYSHGLASLAVLGSVVLAVTGGEALYADMGHFGRRAIQYAWLFFVLPCLVINYFGQGALVLSDPTAISNPFYLAAPAWALWPLLILAACATVIASQAVISGAFSLTHAAVQLGYLPRREIRHTSDCEKGQVYIPRNNWTLLACVLVLIICFRSSDNLAAAYGISVTGAMTIDAILAFIVAVKMWKWKPILAVPLFGLFLFVDLAFLGANTAKIPDGGWLPLLVAAICFTLMFTWWKGRKWLYAVLRRDAAMTVSEFIGSVVPSFHSRTKGTSVFFTSDKDVIPHALWHNIKHNLVLHERVVIATVKYADVPFKRNEGKVEVEDLGEGFFRLVINFGYMEKPDVPSVFPLLEAKGLKLDMMKTSFFLGRESLVASGGSVGLPAWMEPIFIHLSRTSISAAEYFKLPCNRVLELGTQVEI